MNDTLWQSPDFTLSANSKETVTYERDPQNYMTQLFREQMPIIQNGFFTIHMSKGIIVQPHWHTNVTELVYVIGGEVMTSVFNPFTRKLMTYHVKPGEVTQFPKGWFHWIVAMTDDVKFLAIFDQPTPDIVYGSDFLSATPAVVMNRAYCINAEEYTTAVAPIGEPLILGPSLDCVHDGSVREGSSRDDEGLTASEFAQSVGAHPRRPIAN